MKVIKPSQNAQPYETEVMCPACKAVLLVEECDLTRNAGSDQRDRESWDYCTANCCECKHTIRFNNVPTFVRQRLKNVQSYY